MTASTDLLAALPVPVYTTDDVGRLTFYNDAAADLWGYRPELGASWCGSWRLFWPDGRPLPHDECPMARTLKEGRPVRGVEALVERPDGTRVPFVPYPSLLFDEEGNVTGAINLLINLADRNHAHIESARLAAIVASSDDAIISKTLDGTITTWNIGATRLFGFNAEEMIGSSILRIIPPELYGEERSILARISRGEHVDHFETTRITKDGRRLNVSVTVSPLYDQGGKIVGASKVGRDVTERKRAEELQRLLVEELNHRVKNTLATIQAIASQSLRRASSPSEFVTSFNGRVQALARAHDLLVQTRMQGADVLEIVREQVLLGTPETNRISCDGPILMLDSRTTVHVALVLHELATNARKYGALSVPDGRLAIAWELNTDGGRELHFTWEERNGPKIRAPSSSGFGTTLIERTVQGSGGVASVRWLADGLIWTVRIPVPEPSSTIGMASLRPQVYAAPSADDRSIVHGRRILIIEDEPLVSMEMEAQLAVIGCSVVGRAGTVEAAKALIATTECDGVLLDANLAGEPVDEIAALLTRRNIPFAFATGYGSQALPKSAQHVPVLTKPFESEQIATVLAGLFEHRNDGEIVPLARKRSREPS